MKNTVKFAIPAAAIFLSAAAVATPLAHADADSAYLAALSSQGISWSSDSTVIAVGHAVCTDWAAGNTLQQTYNDVREALPKLSDDSVAFLIGAATGAYCPQYESKVQ